MPPTSREIAPVLYPHTAAQGYFVHARFGDEQLMTPGQDEYFAEIEEALAIGIGWINSRRPIDAKALRVSCVHRRNRDILAMALRFEGVKRCGLIVARHDFEIPRREKDFSLPWWMRFPW
jgi:hypothetical protein